VIGDELQRIRLTDLSSCVVQPETAIKLQKSWVYHWTS